MNIDTITVDQIKDMASPELLKKLGDRMFDAIYMEYVKTKGALNDRLKRLKLHLKAVRIRLKQVENRS